ncbi:cytochrome c-type biogenesis protein [Salinicola acroporae]|uniref:Cytochrome c-type biogenesis protein n=1 Tax=Salinicola acroporae TaxID=1541440 RepID=A0ABT6I9H4_9GAMM|nr:cytochrome c-type biogenesis protein [Salinicola acroporae]MDH4574137.1 cytochrome c-type biogenesis protein CcmH [Salinicola acroporae]
MAAMTRRLLSICLLAIVILTGTAAIAAIEVQDFEDPALMQRYEDLTTRLRCPKCQNESIGASNSPIAADMRERVAALLRNGQSDRQIENAMVSRFGDYALYDPRLDARTWLLWGLPFGLLAIGAGVVAGFVLRRRRRDGRESASAVLDEHERRRLEALISRHDAGSHGRRNDGGAP